MPRPLIACLLVALVCLSRPCVAQQTRPAAEATFEPAFVQLIERARDRAAHPYRDQAVPLPPALAALGYDGHRDIRCPPGKFLWAESELPFRVQFRHRGWLFKNEVLLSQVGPSGEEVTPLPFSPERFVYGPVARETLDPATLPSDLGYAGLSLHRVGPRDEQGEETYNELMSIQGGCYFRAVGYGQHWGSSVRAVAINTALPDPEEFPEWVELWVKQPEPGDDHLVLYGMLDGPTVAGAYRLDVTPGETLSVEVTARLFFRQTPTKLGLAPITSMFLFGEDTPARYDDYRPEVHDADGLLMQNGDGHLDWRPLRNPPATAVSRFKMTDPQGFGLIQRDRAFDSYEDLETEMNIRPSVWVTPHEGFGEGWVELLELSSKDEGEDNIGAYWVPADAESISAGDERSLSYRIEFTQNARPSDVDEVRFTQTRVVLPGEGDAAKGSVVRTAEGESGRPVARFIIDTETDAAQPNGTIVRADVQAGLGHLIGKPVIQYNRFRNGYRVFFDVERESDKPVELRATLRLHDGEPLTETWLYRWE